MLKRSKKRELGEAIYRLHHPEIAVPTFWKSPRNAAETKPSSPSAALTPCHPSGAAAVGGRSAFELGMITRSP